LNDYALKGLSSINYFRKMEENRMGFSVGMDGYKKSHFAWIFTLLVAFVCLYIVLCVLLYLFLF